MVSRRSYSGRYPSRFQITLPDCHLFPQNILPSGYQKNSPTHLPYIAPESLRFLSPHVNTVAKSLSSLNFITAHFGKWHLGRSHEHWPEHYGFGIAWHGAPDSGPAMPNGYHSPYSFKEGTISCNHSGEYLVDTLTDEVIKFLRAHKDEPFFASVAQFGVHPPFQAPSEESILHFVGKKDPTGVHDNPIMGAMIKSVDDSVGRVVHELNRLGISNNTLFLFVSDNGGNSRMTYNRFTQARAHLPNDTATPEWLQTLRRHIGEFVPPTNNFPLRGSKGTLYEGGLRVPFIAVWPGKIRAGSVTRQLMSTVDIYPTIMDILSDFDSSIERNVTSRYLKEIRGNMFGLAILIYL